MVANYAYTGEYTGDYNELIYLRARFYNPTDGRFTSHDTWSGDISRPLSLNRWMYVEGNPVNYLDPSGHITENQAKRADLILEKLQDNFNVKIKKDWGYVPVPIDPSSLPPFIVTGILYGGCEWQKGIWDIMELETINESLKDLSRSMGSHEKFKRFIGPVTVEKSKRTCGRGCTPWGGHKVIFLDQGKPPTIVDIRNRDTNIDKWTVVHEFGHAWDRNFGWSLSVELEQFTGGHTSPIGRLHKRGSGDCDPSDRLPGCNDYGYFYKGTPPKGSGYGFNRLEDFAESVTAYVYPDEAHVALMEFLNNAKISEPKYYKDYQRLFYYNDYTKTDRWQYINSIIK